MGEPFQPYVYLLASKRNGTLYCGSTGRLKTRVYNHRAGTASVFTRKYAVARLVWCEPHPNMGSAIQREYQIKE